MFLLPRGLARPGQQKRATVSAPGPRKQEAGSRKRSLEVELERTAVTVVTKYSISTCQLVRYSWQSVTVRRHTQTGCWTPVTYWGVE